MARGLALSLAALGVVAAACGGSGSTSTSDATSTSTSASLPTPTSTPTTTAVGGPIGTVSLPPVSFSEVEAEFEAAVDSILVLGRAVADEYLADDVEAIHARFDFAFAAELSVDQLRAGREQIAAQATLGGRGPDRAFQSSRVLRAYRAELQWGEEAMAITVAFNDADQISAMGLSPQLPLPTDPAADHQSDVTYRLPFDGVWFVSWGGDTEIENRHVVTRDQRHALDIVVWKDGGTHSGDGAANEDYGAYGQPVLAPAGGTVVTAVDGLPDQTPQVASDPANPAGNYVAIEVAQGEYVLILHMQPGSIAVGEGDVVDSGQQIGLVGNSGNSFEPHIHVHVQDRPVFDPQATGLPLEFSDYTVNGQAVQKGQPVGGQFVANGQ